MRLIIPIVIWFITSIIFVVLLPNSAVYFITLGLLILLDILVILWYYPKWLDEGRSVKVVRFLKPRMIRYDDLLNVREGYFFPLIWMKSYRVTFTTESGGRSKFLVYSSEVPEQNEKILSLIGKISEQRDEMEGS